MHTLMHQQKKNYTALPVPNSVKTPEESPSLQVPSMAKRVPLQHGIRDLHFIPSYADPNMWYHEARKSNGFEYLEYILVYVEDILCISEDSI